MVMGGAVGGGAEVVMGNGLSFGQEVNLVKNKFRKDKTS